MPTHYITAHQSAIRALAWIRAPSGSTSGVRKLFEDPTVIASGAYDGMECLTDIRTGRASVMNRTRGQCFSYYHQEKGLLYLTVMTRRNQHDVIFSLWWRTCHHRS